MRKRNRPAPPHSVAKQEAAKRGKTAPEGVRGFWLDTRYKVNIEDFNDLLIDQYSNKIGFGPERFFYLLSVVQGLPDEDRNKPFLAELVQQIRTADQVNNKQALEMGLHALRLAVLNVRLFIPLSDEKFDTELEISQAQSKRASSDRKRTPAGDLVTDEMFRSYIKEFHEKYPDRGTRGLRESLKNKFGMGIRAVNARLKRLEIKE